MKIRPHDKRVRLPLVRDISPWDVSWGWDQDKHLFTLVLGWVAVDATEAELRDLISVMQGALGGGSSEQAQEPTPARRAARVPKTEADWDAWARRKEAT